MAAPVHTVLFDLDGTLANTLPDLAFALNAALRSEGMNPIPEVVIRPWITEGGRAMVDIAVGAERDAETRDRIRHRFLDIYGENLSLRTRLFPEIDEALDTLDRRGIRWGIVTNKLSAFTQPLVRELGLSERAACIVSGDTTPYTKPHPAPLIHACREAGATPGNALYFGDAEKDVLAGRRAGMRTLVALYGYIADGSDPRSWGANGTVSSPAGLIAWLDRNG